MRAGRPPLEAGQRRRTVTFSTSRETYERLHALARLRETTVSDVIRRACDAALRRPNDIDAGGALADAKQNGHKKEAVS